MTDLECSHGRTPGHPCPHCLGIDKPLQNYAESSETMQEEWEERFDKLTDIEACSPKTTLLRTSGEDFLEYPESYYEIDENKVKEFIRTERQRAFEEGYDRAVKTLQKDFDAITGRTPRFTQKPNKGMKKWKYNKRIYCGKLAILLCSKLSLGFGFRNTTKLYRRFSFHINLWTVQISFNQ